MAVDALFQQKGLAMKMNKEQDRRLDELAAAAAHGMSRMTFIKRALALGIGVPAIASALEALEGPSSWAAAATTPIQVNFGSWGSLDEQVTANQVLAVFMKRNPNIVVQPEYTTFSDYFVKLNSDLAAKSIPDVMFLTYVPAYASKGALQPIKSAAKRAGKSFSTAGYSQGQLFLFEYNGNLYGVPRDTDTKVIFFNRKMFRAAGVPYPKSDWSWDDLRATAKKLTKGSGSRISQYGFAYETDFWRLWLWQKGVQLFDNDAKPTKVTFNTPAGVQALQFIANLTNKDQVTPPPTQMAASATIASLFTGQQLAMAFGNHALVPTFVKTPGLDWSVVGMPHFAGHPTVNASGGAGYTISAFTTVQDAAYALWEFLTGPVAIKMFSEGNDVTPINPQILKSSYWLSKPYNAVFAQQTKYGHLLPSFPTFFDVYTAADTVLQKLWAGEGTATTLLPQAAAAATKVLKSEH